MKIERLKKNNKKKIVIGVSIVVLIIMGVVGFVGTKAKYKYTATIPLVSGTIHYKSGDLSVLAVNLENESGGFTESDNIPSEGYILNRDKSYCGLSNGDGTYTNEAVTMNYHDGVMAFDNITKKGTKCFLYFNKPNYLVTSAGGDTYTNETLGKGISRSSFESITTVASKSVPANAIESWDVSHRHNGSIMAWYTDTNSNGLYELYIGQDGGVKGHPNSSFIFSGYSKLTSLDLSHYDTSDVITMNAMFYYTSLLTNLDLSHFNTSNVNDMSNMFAGMSSLTSLNVSSFNTSKVTSMWGMFHDTKLTSLDLSHFNTSNVVTMAQMFQGMSSLTTLNVSSFDTAKVTSMDAMFYQTSSLTSLNLSNFNTSNVKVMSNMFAGMRKVTNLNVSSFNTSEVTNMWAMFANTTSLQTLNLKNATFGKVANYADMFVGSNVKTIYVKDTNAKDFVNARLSEVGKTATITIG